LVNYNDFDDEMEDQPEQRSKTYRVRKAQAVRRNSNNPRSSNKKKPAKPAKMPNSTPGGIRQRRNKHWNW
tara:strand:+ start:434 stop:643 length:210 start_codon:yes stop_codon:yes gene_type:complete